MLETSSEKLSKKQREELIQTLKDRFDTHMNRHEGLEWAPIQSRLEALFFATDATTASLSITMAQTRTTGPEVSGRH